ncbi:MAG: ABC transporter substrate-binding protein [Tepidisphaeraceae bacterium]
MRQTTRRSLLLAASLLLAGCGKDTPPPGVAADTIVCLSPAASDLLVAMGLTPRIVAVSGYEANPTLRRTLPNAGDYQRIDWERLAELKPGFLIIQGAPDRLPGGIAERCAAMGITPIVLSIDRIADIEHAIHQLGDALHAPAAAAKLDATFHQQLAGLSDPQRAKVPALIVLNDSGTAVVGRSNFINDALQAAGGENVITADGYPSIDREKLLTLHPAVIFLLMPGASDSTVARAKQAMGTTHATVCPITRADALLPGTAVVELARQFADQLKATPP